jgi:hypothetical protein
MFMLLEPEEVEVTTHLAAPMVDLEEEVEHLQRKPLLYTKIRNVQLMWESEEVKVLMVATLGLYLREIF